MLYQTSPLPVIAVLITHPCVPSCFRVDDWLSGVIFPHCLFCFFTASVLSNAKNPGSSNGPPMVHSWVVRITFWWSVYAVAKNDDKTFISLLCCLLSTIIKAYILRSCSVSKARDFYLKFSNHFEIGQAARNQCCQAACQLSNDWSISQSTQSCQTAKKSVANLLVAKRSTQGASMGCPFHLWVAFGGGSQ